MAIKKSELKNMNEKQLMDRLYELKKQLMKTNAQRSTKTTPENPGQIRAMKKSIAKVLTKLNNIDMGVEKKKQV